MIRLLALLGVAALGGTIIGIEREWSQKSAGLRTHMLVSVGAAMFVLSAPLTPDALSRTLQGVAAGVGFIGGGTIMKEGGRIEGITTATTIWIASAIGACVASGHAVVGIAGAILSAFTLVGLRSLEQRIAEFKASNKLYNRPK